jgi:hypothetical protein
MIEVMLTLGGFLGIITSLLQDLLVTQAKTSFVVIIVLFMVFGFLAYASVSIPLPANIVRIYVGGLGATFAGLIVIALSIPLSNATVGIAIQSVSYIGVVGAIVIYLVLLFALIFVIYWVIVRAVLFTFRQLAPDRDHAV